MKIGLVLDDGLDRSDGVQQYVLGLGKWLSKNGHEVHYLVGETLRTDIENLHVLSRNLQVRFNANSLSTPLPASKLKIRELLDKEQFDVLHVQVPYSPFMAARIINLAPKKTKIIGTFHVLPYGLFQKYCTIALGYWLRNNSRRFDTMLAVSSPAGELCYRCFGLKPKIVGNHININKFTINKRSYGTTNSTKLKVVFLGRLVERKGCMELLKAIHEILQKGLTEFEFELIIGGSGPQESQLHRYIENTNLQTNVEFKGFIAEEKKADFLNQADIAVFPSISGESFGIVLLEAMAAKSGVVLAGNNPGYSSVFNELPEVLFDPKNTSEFAKTLAGFLNDSKKRLRLYQAQQKLVRKFDINEVGKSVLVSYSALAKNPPSRQTKG